MEAIAKINAEMQKDPNNGQVEIIGHYIIDRASLEPECADLITVEDKTLTGAMKTLMDSARKKAKNRCAILTHQEVFSIIDQYFGFTLNEGAQMRALGISSPIKPQPKKENVAVNLADFF